MVSRPKNGQGASGRNWARRLLINLLLGLLPSLLVCFLAAEVVFRLFIPACQFPNPIWDPEYQIIKFDAVHGPRDGVFTVGRFARQRARWHINNAGWNSAVDYTSPRQAGKRRIAIVGDSYVEGFAVDCDKSVAADLRRRLGDGAEVYSFGVSGACLSQYLQMSRYVAKAFNPDVLVINVVHNDFDESLRDFKTTRNFLQIRSDGATFQEVEPTPYRPSWFKRLLKKSAFVRYLTENLKIRGLFENARFRPRTFNANVDVQSLDKNQPLIRAATLFLIQKISEENRARRVLFMIDAPRSDLYEGHLETSSVIWMNKMLRDICGELSCQFLDLTGPFSEHWKAHHQRFESGEDWHWNELGHQVAAAALAKALSESPKPGLPQGQRRVDKP